MKIISISFTLGFSALLSDPQQQGNFGPFQTCYDYGNQYGISVCGGHPGGFQTRGKLITILKE